MTYTATYLIRGTPALSARIHERNLDDFDYLVGPFVWTNVQGGRTVYDPDDYTAAIKRLFVAHMKHVALRAEDANTVFGDLPIAESTFDRWWTVEVLGVDEDAAAVVEQMRRSGHTDALKQVGLPLVWE